ncbi:MAG: CcmD family protein [Chitinophagaceae bacterium]|nr:CcmD family protein [Chitinophagaceae bacterium]MCA6453133.1 CcmD family protein [Chitinophagaceae bacterium]MCA6455282.1 CcmD family protein [Chitinophagaceae bacterium]MCA6457829.1 CcmD family protein [Chitinophagaceae bacterium]MCA6463542.1 CcmD family protein [Chitinophagaceae bacterium]
MSTAVQAQETAAAADNAGLMRSNGKIYVVVAVVVTILLGLFAYVFSLDRKITKLEKNS